MYKIRRNREGKKTLVIEAHKTPGGGIHSAGLILPGVCARYRLVFNLLQDRRRTWNVRPEKLLAEKLLVICLASE